MKYAKILGTGKALPKKVVTNYDLEKIVETSDEWIYSRSGIKERRIAVEETVSSMATESAKKALEIAKINPIDIDMIIVATMSAEYTTPAIACLVQKELGADNAMAFDLSAACSGFVFALNTADQFIKSGASKRALVIGSEKLSQILNWEDRATCVLFADGAGAVVLGDSDQPGVIASKCKSIGKDYACLTAKTQRFKNPFEEQEKEATYLEMEGREVFEFACTKVPACIEELLEESNILKQEIDYYILHQANTRIIKRVAKVLEEDLNKFYTNMEFYGNTSAASVAIALDEMYRSDKLKGKTVVLAGFGAGLTYGASVIKF